jgi:hypothetical protein
VKKRRTVALRTALSQRSASGWGSGRSVNCFQAPDGVGCSRLALRSGPGPSLQPTDARDAHKATSSPANGVRVRGQTLAQQVALLGRVPSGAATSYGWSRVFAAMVRAARCASCCSRRGSPGSSPTVTLA